jgi:hypothetical protein
MVLEYYAIWWNSTFVVGAIFNILPCHRKGTFTIVELIRNIAWSFIFADYNCVLKCNRFVWLVVITICLSLYCSYSVKCCMIRFLSNVNWQWMNEWMKKWWNRYLLPNKALKTVIIFRKRCKIEWLRWFSANIALDCSL